MSTEKSLQDFILREFKKLGCSGDKVESKSRRGFPDLFIRTRKNSLLIEVKSPTGKGSLSKHQVNIIEELRALGQQVFVVESKEEVEMLLGMVKRGTL